MLRAFSNCTVHVLQNESAEQEAAFTYILYCTKRIVVTTFIVYI